MQKTMFLLFLSIVCTPFQKFLHIHIVNSEMKNEIKIQWPLLIFNLIYINFMFAFKWAKNFHNRERLNNFSPCFPSWKIRSKLTRLLN